MPRHGGNQLRNLPNVAEREICVFCGYKKGLVFSHGGARWLFLELRTIYLLLKKIPQSALSFQPIIGLPN